jgi:hypothetical protein
LDAHGRIVWKKAFNGDLVLSNARALVHIRYGPEIRCTATMESSCTIKSAIIADRFSFSCLELTSLAFDGHKIAEVLGAHKEERKIMWLRRPNARLLSIPYQ